MTYNVMIRCPVAGTAVATGIVCDVRSFEALDREMECHCPACGQNHQWSVEDAWLRDSKMEQLLDAIHGERPL